MNGLGAKINGELKSVGIIMIISTDNTDNNYSLTIMLPVSSVFSPDIAGTLLIQFSFICAFFALEMVKLLASLALHEDNVNPTTFCTLSRACHPARQ